MTTITTMTNTMNRRTTIALLPPWLLQVIMVVMMIATCLAAGDLLADEPTDPLTHANALSKAFRQAAEKASPSVVVVRSEVKPQPAAQGRGPQRGGENPFKGTPFEDFFRDGLPEGF
ncbi:MAG: hypothetical protein ACKOEX_11885, partial [Planctomycetia bacterium]